MNRLYVRPRPKLDGAGFYWVATDRETRITTYGEDRDEAVFIAGEAFCRYLKGNGVRLPVDEWVSMEELGLLDELPGMLAAEDSY